MKTHNSKYHKSIESVDIPVIEYQLLDAHYDTISYSIEDTEFYCEGYS